MLSLDHRERGALHETGDRETKVVLATAAVLRAEALERLHGGGTAGIFEVRLVMNSQEEDNRSLSLTLEAQIRMRPPRDRVEIFGREACTLIGTALRDYMIVGLGERLAELQAAQFPEDQPACEELLKRLHGFLDQGSAPLTEPGFQSLVDEAVCYGPS